MTYMSPEQTYGMELDHRTDVWSLGVVIYEMVTGQRPFKGHYDKAVMYSITNEEPEPMTALRTGVPMELELLVNKCLAKEADRRYQSTADMVVDLETLSDKLKSGKSTILTPQAARQTEAAPPTAAVPPSPGPLARYRVIENLAEQGDSRLSPARGRGTPRASFGRLGRMTQCLPPLAPLEGGDPTDHRSLDCTAVGISGGMPISTVSSGRHTVPSRMTTPIWARRSDDMPTLSDRL